MARIFSLDSLMYGRTNVSNCFGEMIVLVFCFTHIAATAAMEVQIQEWELPTSDSLPHDPAVAPDGSLWYTGMHSNTLGRLDPKTGAIKEYRVKTPDSGPHGLVADKDGNIWFTANAKDTSGSSFHRPARLRSTLCPILPPTTRIVRFDPTRQAFTTWPIPSGGGVVRNIVATPEGNIYIACSGVNKVGIVRVRK